MSQYPDTTATHNTQPEHFILFPSSEICQSAENINFIGLREFDHERIETRVRLDSVEEWEYVNTSTMDHPMHIHTNPLQVVGSGGELERAWKDVVVVKVRSNVRLRIKSPDFAEKTVQHCHILDHEDRCMMATILMEP